MPESQSKIPFVNPFTEYEFDDPSVNHSSPSVNPDKDNPSPALDDGVSAKLNHKDRPEGSSSNNALTAADEMFIRGQKAAKHLRPESIEDLECYAKVCLPPQVTEFFPSHQTNILFSQAPRHHAKLMTMSTLLQIHGALYTKGPANPMTTWQMGKGFTVSKSTY